MKFRPILLAPLAAICALLSSPTLAQQRLPTPQPLAAEPAPVEVQPALWKIADQDTTIYLFGTIHLLPQGIDWYHGKLATAFEQSQVLVTEIPETPDGEAAGMMVKHGTLPAGQTLRALLSEEQRRKYDATMDGIGLPPASFDRYKPWFAAVVLATLPLQKQGYDIQHGVETELTDRAKALGHPRVGLETLDYQLGLFDGLPAPLQADYLLSVIDAMPTLKEEIGKMIDSWSRGDAVDLAKQMNAEEDDPVLMQVLLVNRNKNWAHWIEQRLEQPGTVFIAVGAGHLGGPESVQAQLGKDGVQAVRVQ